MFVLSVDDACFAGKGTDWAKALHHNRRHFMLGKAEYGTFTFLGRQPRQKADFTIDRHPAEYVNGFTRVHNINERNMQSKHKLNDGRNTTIEHWSAIGMARKGDDASALRCSVLCFQHNVDIVIVGDLIHAHHLLHFAKKVVVDGHRLKCMHFGRKQVFNESDAETPKQGVDYSG